MTNSDKVPSSTFNYLSDFLVNTNFSNDDYLRSTAVYTPAWPRKGKSISRLDVGFEEYPPLSWEFLTQHFTPFSHKSKIILTINPTCLHLQFPRNISWTLISLLNQFVSKEFVEGYANQIWAILDLSFNIEIYCLWTWIKWEQTMIEQFIDLMGNSDKVPSSTFNYSSHFLVNRNF